MCTLKDLMYLKIYHLVWMQLFTDVDINHMLCTRKYTICVDLLRYVHGWTIPMNCSIYNYTSLSRCLFIPQFFVLYRDIFIYLLLFFLVFNNFYYKYIDKHTFKCKYYFTCYFIYIYENGMNPCNINIRNPHFKS